MSIFTANRLAHAQALATAGTDPRWVKLVNFTDLSITYDKDHIDWLPAFATRWLAANHAPSGVALHDIMMDIVNNPSWVSMVNDLDTHFWLRTVIWECAVTFDIAKSLFSVAEQNAFAALFEAEARRLLFEYTGNYNWGEDTPGSNYFYGYMMFWPMAHALAGRPFWDDLATKMRARYDNFMVPWFTGEGTGGLYIESTNYESTHRLCWVLDAHKQATGEDLFTNSWFNQAERWAQHRLMPGDANLAGIGDQPVTGMAELNDNTILRMISLAANAPDTPQRSRLWDRADRISWPALRDNTNVWQGVLYSYEQDTHARTDYKVEPLSYKAGLVYIRRTAWGDADAACAFKDAADVNESHQERAAPFKLWYRRAYLWASIVQRSHGGSGDPWSEDTIVLGDGIYPAAVGMYWNGKKENALDVALESPVSVLNIQQRSGYYHPPLHNWAVNDDGVSELWDLANGLIVHYERFVPITALAATKRRRIFQTGDEPVLSTNAQGQFELTAGDTIFGSDGMMRITWLTPSAGFVVTDFPPEIDGRVWCRNVEVILPADLHAYAIQFYPKGQTPPVLNTVMSWDGHEAIVQSVTLTAPPPTTLPPLDGGGGPPPSPTKPPPPSGLSCVAGDGENDLSWSESSGATSYKVLRALQSGGPYTVVNIGTGTVFIDRGLTNGVIYYYVIVASNLSGDSTYSNQVFGTPHGAVVVLGAQCRYSAMNVGSPWRGLRALPSASPDQGTRQAVQFMSSCILANQPIPSVRVYGSRRESRIVGSRSASSIIGTRL